MPRRPAGGGSGERRSSVRKLGLCDVLRSEGTGWMLDPAVDLLRVRDEG